MYIINLTCGCVDFRVFYHSELEEAEVRLYFSLFPVTWYSLLSELLCFFLLYLVEYAKMNLPKGEFSLNAL